MKIIIWNVQGAKKAQLQLEVGFLSRTINSDILILTETMVNEQNAQQIIRTLGFRNFDFILPQNHVGGIWLLWKDNNVDLDNIAKEHRAIHCSVFEKGTNKQCVVTTVYAPTQNHKKPAFWNYLKKLNESITLSWCILGDFNEMLHPFEKIEGTQVCSSQLQRLTTFLHIVKAMMLMSKAEISHGKNFYTASSFMKNLIELSLGKTVSVSSRII